MILDKYSFVFGFGFLKELNKQHTMASNGLTMRLGLENTLPNLINNDVETLIEVLKLANKTETPRASEKDLIEVIESTEDIESLFAETLEALKESNFTGMKTRKFLETVEKNNGK